MTTQWKSALAAIALTPLALTAACGSNEAATSSTGTADEGSQTLASALGSNADLSQMREALDEAELASVFDGPASYTVLAPDNAAFSSLGDEGTSLMQEKQRPLLVAILRDHMLPGHLTPEAIGKAIDEAGGPVTMTSLGEDPVVFSRAGDALVMTAPDGSTANIAGAAVATSNGVIIPIDKVLMPKKQGA